MSIYNELFFDKIYDEFVASTMMTL